MMLHRHFENETKQNVTTLKDVTPCVDKDTLSHEESAVEAPKRRGRPKKTEE